MPSFSRGSERNPALRSPDPERPEGLAMLLIEADASEQDRVEPSHIDGSAGVE
jgi:hypothetical protein